MGVPILRREFIVGDLVTIAPDFRHGVDDLGRNDFDFEKYLGIVIEKPEDGEYIIYWTQSPSHNPYRGMWPGDHLVRVEDYEIHRKSLHSPKI